MASNRTPAMRYNGSGYVDLAARDAIHKAYKRELAERKRRLIAQILTLADEAGFYIENKIILVDKECDD